MDWYPWHFELYANDTMHLTCLQDGAYRRLIDHYMKTRQALPDDDRALANITRLGLADWQEIAADVRAFFKPRNGKLYQTRCEQTLASQEKGSTTRSETAKKAAEARWLKEKEKNAHSMLEASSKHARAMLGDARGEERREEEKDIPTPSTATEREAPPHVNGSGHYAFAGSKIKLILRDIERFKVDFPNIADIEGEIAGLDDWCIQNPTRAPGPKWFPWLRKKLAEKNQERGLQLTILERKGQPLRKVSRARAVQILKDAGKERASPAEQRQHLASSGFDPESLKG